MRPDPRSLAFWPLFALLVPQALWVRRSTPRFAGAPGPREGTTGNGATHRLVGLGDSVIDGVGCSSSASALTAQTAEALAERTGACIHWRMAGRSGADTRRIRSTLLPGAGIEAADFVVVSAGVNDVTGLKRRATFRAELSGLLADIRSRAPSAIVAVAGLPPMDRFPALPQPLRAALGLRARQFDRVVSEVAANAPGVVRIGIDLDATDIPATEQFAPDGYHPSASACRELASALADALLDADPS